MAYNLLDLRTRVRKKIKDTSYSSSNIDGFINDAQVEIADLFEWPQFEKVVTGALTIGEYTYEQQPDHQLTTRLILLDPDEPTRNWNLTSYYIEQNEFFERFPAPDTLDNSVPLFWTEYGNQIYFNCPCDLAYELRQYFTKVPTELTADADVPELPQNFREALVLGAAYRVEEERDNYDIAAVLRNQFNDRVSDLIMRLSNRTGTGPDTVILPPRKGI